MADDTESAAKGVTKSKTTGKRRVWRNACTVPIDLASGQMLAPDATIDKAPDTKHDKQLVDLGMLVEEEVAE
jgi:hypothetical protein